MRTVGMGAKKAETNEELLLRLESLEKENASLKAALNALETDNTEPKESKSKRTKKSDEE